MLFCTKNMDNPRLKETFDKAYANFKALLHAELANIQPDCFCAYPRIVDFIFKNTTDAYLLKNLLISDCLINTHVDYGIFYEEEIYHYTCKNCSSEYQHTYQERGRNEWEVLKLVPKNVMGKAVNKLTPNYLDGLYLELFNKESYLENNQQFKASAEEVRDYLFEKLLS